MENTITNAGHPSVNHHMWHEARKQERKIRGMLVDYRKRAERRQDFYEKIKADPTQFMQIHSRKCKIHLDPAVAAAGDSPAIMMPWQGLHDNMIDRFDGRAHLDLDKIPVAPKCKEGGAVTEELSSDERQCNYERYRILAQNDFLAISEEKYLHQLYLEEQFGINAHEQVEKPKKKTGGAAIGYTYEDSNDPTPFSQTISHVVNSGGGGASAVASGGTGSAGGGATAEDDSDSDLDVDVAIDISKIDTAQAHELNACGRHYGMKSNDFYSFLTKDADEADALKLAREEEQEKIMLSGRKSRRERRAQRERRFAGRPISPPSYAAKEETPFKDDEKNDSAESRSPTPENSGKITYITSFGGEDELQPHSKISINFNKNAKSTTNSNSAGSGYIITGQAVSYADKVKQNLDKLKKLNEIRGRSASNESPKKPLAYQRCGSSYSRSRSRGKRTSASLARRRGGYSPRSRSRSRRRRNSRRSRSVSSRRSHRRRRTSRSVSSRRSRSRYSRSRSRTATTNTTTTTTRRYSSSSMSSSTSSSDASARRRRRRRLTTSSSSSSTSPASSSVVASSSTSRSRSKSPVTQPLKSPSRNSVSPVPPEAIPPSPATMQLPPPVLLPTFSVPPPPFAIALKPQVAVANIPPPPVPVVVVPTPVVKLPEPDVPIKKYYGRRRDDQTSSDDDDLHTTESIDEPMGTSNSEHANHGGTNAKTSASSSSGTGHHHSSSTSLHNSHASTAHSSKFGKQPTTSTSTTTTTVDTKASVAAAAAALQASKSSASAVSLSSINPRDRLKRKMQILLNKQYKADKLAEIEKTERQVQQQQEREDEMRELALRLRRRQRELRHKYGTPSNSHSDGSDNKSSDEDDNGAPAIVPPKNGATAAKKQRPLSRSRSGSWSRRSHNSGSVTAAATLQRAYSRDRSRDRCGRTSDYRHAAAPHDRSQRSGDAGDRPRYRSRSRSRDRSSRDRSSRDRYGGSGTTGNFNRSRRGDYRSRSRNRRSSSRSRRSGGATVDRDRRGTSRSSRKLVDY